MYCDDYCWNQLARTDRSYPVTTALYFLQMVNGYRLRFIRASSVVNGGRPVWMHTSNRAQVLVELHELQEYVLRIFVDTSNISGQLAL